MKRFACVLCCILSFIGAFPSYSSVNDTVDKMLQELEKCDLSIRSSILDDIIECMEHSEHAIGIKERLQLTIGLVKCVKLDINKITDCISQISIYIPELKTAKYKDVMTCSPLIEISSFQELENVEDNKPVLGCRKPFSDTPESIEQKLTKNEFVQHIFSDEGRFVLIENSLILYSIGELEIYFEYMRKLYEKAS